MSKNTPILPRNADQKERFGYHFMDFYRSDGDAVIAAGLAIVLAGVGKAVLKTELLGMSSVKKTALTFVTIAGAGMAANRLRNMSSDHLASRIIPPK